LFFSYELGYPESSHQKGTTGRQTATVAPVFNERSKLRINRKERQFLRYIKRHGIKFEVRIIVGNPVSTAYHYTTFHRFGKRQASLKPTEVWARAN
jgi:hypothetical protein